MGRYYRRGRPSSHRRNYTRNIGAERAAQHIEEAKALSRELGGTDRDVKAYFFGLPAQQLRAILDAYEAAYGRAKREYAEQTMPRWRSGQTHMSGLVAGRLYNLLPPRMPLEHKYQLTRSLWQHVCPSTHKVLRIGPDADEENIFTAVQSHMSETVKSYFINEGLVARFKWLSGGDVRVQQQLLNHLLQVEKEAASQATRARLPVLLKHIREEGGYTKRLAQFVEIGKHKLEIVFDQHSAGVKVEEPRAQQTRAAGAQYLWVWVLIGVVILIVFLMQHRH